MPVWTLILLWPVHTEKCFYQTKCGLRHHEKLRPSSLPGLFLMNVECNRCAQPARRVGRVWAHSAHLSVCHILKYGLRFTWNTKLLSLNPSSVKSLSWVYFVLNCITKILENWVTISHSEATVMYKWLETTSWFSIKVIGSQFNTLILCRCFFHLVGCIWQHCQVNGQNYKSGQTACAATDFSLIFKNIL